MTRWKAAAIHLSISAAIGLFSALLIFFVWYPSPYGQALGAQQLVLLLLGVDVILGPLLTLVVFKSGKKSLRFDLAIIALLQVCAFSYGMSVVVRARPAFVVSVVDQFVLVGANDLDPADLAQGSKPAFQYVPWNGPMIVGSQIPTEFQAHTDLLFSGLAGKDIEKFPKLYVDYAGAAPGVLAHAKSLDELIGKHPPVQPVVDEWLTAHHREATSISWVPLKTRRVFMTMLLDSTSGQPIDALPIDPW